ncbi:MAG: proteasome accessory factor PafA2 family protein, partial [Actinomycetes bacterium]
DMTGRRKVRLANGKEMSALEIQSEYHSRAAEFVDREGFGPVHRQMLELWGRVLKAVDTGDLSLIDREIDWATKYQLIERYRAKRDLPMSSPRVAQMDLAYHDISRTRGLYYLLERNNAVDRVAHEPRVFEAKNVPPQTTRARLRGEFIRKAQEKRRDFTVDWVHLKLNDQAQRTVLCKDPFRAHDDRVDKLIASM